MPRARPRSPARTCMSPHLQRGPPCGTRLIYAKAGTVAAAIPPAVAVVFLALPRPSGDAPRPGSAARPCRSPPSQPSSSFIASRVSPGATGKCPSAPQQTQTLSAPPCPDGLFRCQMGQRSPRPCAEGSSRQRGEPRGFSPLAEMLRVRGECCPKWSLQRKGRVFQRRCPFPAQRVGPAASGCCCSTRGAS